MVKRKASLAFADTSSHSNEGTHTSSRMSHCPNGRQANAQKQDLTEAIGSDSDDIDFVEEMHVPSTSAAAMPSSTSASSSSSSLAKRGQRYQQRCESKDQQHKVQRAGDSLTQREEDDIMRAIELSKLEMEVEQRRSPVARPQEDSFHRRESPPISDRWPISCSPSSERGSGKSVSSQSDRTEIPQEHIANDAREEMDGSASDLSQDSTDMLTSGQPTLAFKRSGLQRDRFHTEDGDSCQPRQRLRAPVVPEPPNLTSLEEFQDTEEEEEEEEEGTAEIDVVRSDGGMSEAEGFQDDEVPDGQIGTSLKVFKLVDTRKPLLPREPYYAPQHSNKDAYTKIIYHLIQTYCQRLRRAQSKVLTRVLWGKPVVTGNCYSDTLLHRKRGSKASMFYTLSESDDDQGPTATSQQDNMSVSSRRRKHQKRPVIEEEADSDLEDFVPAGRRKMTPALGKRRLVTQDVVAMLKREIRPSKDKKRGDEPPRAAKLQESQTLSQTLVQDQTESPESCAPHPGVDEMTEFDFTEDPCYPDNKFSQSKETDSLIGATDIYQASSFAHNNGEVEVGTGYKSPEILTKNCDTDKNSSDGKTTAEDSDASGEGGSFGEQTQTPNMHRSASHLINADIETPSKKNNLPTQNTHHSPNCHSINHANLQNGESAADDQEGHGAQEEEPCKSRPLKENDEDEREIEKSSLCTSVPADSSQSGELSGNNTKPGLASFEEARFQFYQEELMSLQQEGSREKDEGCTSDHENSSGPDSGQKSVGSPSSEDFEEQKQSTEDSLQEMLNARLRKNRKPGSIVQSPTRSTNKKQERQSCLSQRKAQPLSNSRSAPESKLTRTFQSRHLKKFISEDGKHDETEKHEDYDNGGDEETNGEDANECFDDGDLGGWKEVNEEAPSLDPTKDDSENEEVIQGDAWDGVDGDCITLGEGQKQSDDAEDDSNTTLPHSEDGEEEDIVEEVTEVGSRNQNDPEEDTRSSMIGVECPLCGVQYPIDQIEAHASGCNGPPSSPPEVDGLDQEEAQETPEFSQGPLLRGGLHMNSDSSSASSHYNQRDPFSTERKTLRPQRGVAIRIVQQELPKKTNLTTAKPEDDKRSLPLFEEDSSESFSESSDHLDATLLQFVEDNQIQLRERKRVRVPDRPAKRQKVADGDSGHPLSNGTEATELCFLCHKHVPKSSYAEHVQEEIDLAEAQKHSEDTPTLLPRRALRSRMPMSRAAGGESSREAEHGPDQSVSFISTTKYPTTEDWEPDSDVASDSDGDSQSPSPQEDALFNPRVSESPIKSFRPISKQPMNLIDFQNQFNTNSGNNRKGNSSSRSSARFKKGKRGQKRKWKGKRK